MAMDAKVRRLRLRDDLSISEIARRTSLSRNTIKEWLRGPVRDEMRYRRPRAPRKITPYEATLQEALEVDAHRPRRERRTALKLYAQLIEQGFPGSYARVTEFIRAWRADQGAVTARSAYVPLSFAWGEAFQFDWREAGLVIGGLWRKVQLAHMKLCASRAFWLVGYPSQGHEMLFDAHALGLPDPPAQGLVLTPRLFGDRPDGRPLRRMLRELLADQPHRALPDFGGVPTGMCHRIHPLNEWTLRQTRYGSPWRGWPRSPSSLATWRGPRCICDEPRTGLRTQARSQS
jgi:transcriptional regulator with XRE-family HTH domain